MYEREDNRYIIHICIDIERERKVFRFHALHRHEFMNTKEAPPYLINPRNLKSDQGKFQNFKLLKIGTLIESIESLKTLCTGF